MGAKEEKEKDPSKEQKGGEGDGGDQPAVEELQAEITKLEEDKANLNKGVASYRDKNQELEKDLKDKEAELKKLQEKKDPEDETDDERFDRRAKERGFVTKDELNKTSQEALQQQAISDFLQKNPDYDSDENWELFKAEFSLYKAPATYQGYISLFEKIVGTLSGDVEKAKEEGKSEAKIEAKQKSRMSLGGGSQKTGTGDRAQRIEKLQAKYSNLSKSQIESRLDELDEVYKDKEDKED